MKVDTLILKTDEYFDGKKWGKVPSWMVGRYVAKRTEKKFRRPKKRSRAKRQPTAPAQNERIVNKGYYNY